MQNSSNRLVIALGIFSIILLICLAVLIWDRSTIQLPIPNKQDFINNANNIFKNTEDFKKSQQEKLEQMISIPQFQETEDTSNDTINDINYLFRDKFSYMVEPNEIITNDSINELVAEIEESEEQETKIDEKELALSLEENKFFVYVGHFEEDDALRLINYLQYQNYKAFLKTSNEINFVIVEFNEKEKADEFVIWAKKNSFHDATLIKK